PQPAARPSIASRETPVDMTQYAEIGRIRPDAGLPGQSNPLGALGSMAAAADRIISARLSIARRPGLDLPLAAAPAAREGQRAPGGETDRDFDLNSPFDVPAFLRRQEG